VDGDQYTIELLDVALDVIEGLSGVGGEPLRASELSRKLDLNRTRVFRILKTLERRGYVQADHPNQGYRLGLKLLWLGEQVRQQLDLYRVAKPVLRELARDTGDTAVLVVLHGHSAVCVDRFQGENILQAEDPIGQPLPLHIGASPKILLAHLPQEQRERIIEGMELNPFTPNTITDRQELCRRLDEIRAQGYAVDEEDFELGVYATGAPVRDHSGRVVAGVTVTTPTIRYNPQRGQDLIALVVAAAKRLSAQLGWVEQA
jgi:DNA-binding IclR family transcriptional regulator